MREICGKSALVTGAASGIGRAVAMRLASERVRLFLVDIDEVGLATVVQNAQKFGVEVIGRRCDVGDPAAVTATVTEILSRWGGVDILINNAGITYYGPTAKMSAEHWDRVLRVNLYSHIQFTQELLPSMLERRESHIVNICSMFGLVGMPKLAAYSTTKFALVGLSEVLRNECGRDGLGVTAMCPGFVDTNLFTSAPLGENQKQAKEPPRIFRTTPEKVARATVKAIRKNRRMVVMTPAAWLLVSVKRWVPGVMDFVFHLGRRKRVERKMAELKRVA